MATFVLAWVIDRPVQAISLYNILAVTWAFGLYLIADMYARGQRENISGKALMPMLQLLHIHFLAIPPYYVYFKVTIFL